MTNKKARTTLCTIYEAKCMCTEDTTNLTYHHLDKLADGGRTTVANGAILSEESQQWLHCHIEVTDKNLFDLVNECLVLYKKVLDLGNLDLIKQYRDEVIPELRVRIYAYGNRPRGRVKK